MLAHIRRHVAGRRATHEAGTSTVEYAFLIAAIAAVMVALGFAVFMLVQDGFPQGCETTASASADGC